MKLYFVIGNKVSKSLSPLIFNYWFKKYNILAKYSYLEVSKANFEKTLNKKLLNKTIRGFNVTIPFKKEIIKHLDNTSLHAEKIGAVNCVTINKKKLGVNTDWIGFLNSIKFEKIKKQKTILILGYGGAAKAIHYGFIIRGYKKVIVFNRTKKIIKLSQTKKYTKKYTYIDRFLKDAALIINTTPTNPLNKNQIKMIGENTTISDIVYRPKNTVFLKCFKNNKKIFGISMLFEQAVLSFYEWFGFYPSLDEALINKIEKKIR